MLKLTACLYEDPSKGMLSWTMSPFAGGNAEVMCDAAQMIDAGFDIAKEPFLKSTLLCLRSHLLQACTPCICYCILPASHL